MRFIVPFVLSAAILLPVAALSRTAPKDSVTRPEPESDLGFEILVDGRPLEELEHEGETFVEALRDREYAIRLTNRLPVRMAVALSVDGLNTIDAQHTAPNKAAKWVLGPRETVTISGWQVGESAARRFVFTGETDSYGAFVGDTRNLGVIGVVAFKEKERKVTLRKVPATPGDTGAADSSSTADGAPTAGAEAPSRSESSKGKKRKRPRRKDAPAESKSSRTAESAELDEERAATGSGKRFENNVEWVAFDLDPSAVATRSLRYAFRAELVELGVLTALSPKERRKAARAFAPEQP